MDIFSKAAIEIQAHSSSDFFFQVQEVSTCSSSGSSVTGQILNGHENGKTEPNETSPAPHPTGSSESPLNLSCPKLYIPSRIEDQARVSTVLYMYCTYVLEREG